MRYVFLCVLLSIGVSVFGQNPTNYIPYKQRTRQYSMMLDSMLYIPRYNGAPSGVRTNETSSIDGAIAMDTVNNRVYIYSGGGWVRVGNYSDITGYAVDSIWRVAGTDSIFWSKNGTTYKIKDSTGGGTPTLQQVFDVEGKTALMDSAAENTIQIRRGVFNISNGERKFLTVNGNIDNNYVLINTDDAYGSAGQYETEAMFSAGENYGNYFELISHRQTIDGLNHKYASISGDADNSILRLYAQRSSGVIDTVSYIYIYHDSISIKPEAGKLNIDSLRTWSSIGDTLYKKPMTWDTRNGRWEYAANWFGNGSASYTASNGLTLSGSNFKLGGTLGENTTITQDGFTLGISDLLNFADTTNWKPVVVNTTGSGATAGTLRKATYWPVGSGGGGSPAGNFGNLQINRNGAFATPGSDSLDYEASTGLEIKAPLTFRSASLYGTNLTVKDEGGTTRWFSYIDGNSSPVFQGPKTWSFADASNQYFQIRGNDFSSTESSILVRTVVSGKAGVRVDLAGSATNDGYQLYSSGATKLWGVNASGKMLQDATMTAGGTTGAQTINKPAGSVNFAAAATSLVVTNSLVSTSSIIICQIMTNDATATSTQVVPGSGSFTIYLNAAATAETKVAFLVIN